MEEVVIVLPDLTVGGAEVSALYAANAFARGGLAVSVVSLRSNGDLRGILGDTVNVIHLGEEDDGKQRSCDPFRQIYGLYRYLSGRDVCVVHSHKTYADVVASIASRLVRVPHVTTVHGEVRLDGGCLRNIPVAFAHRVICVSQSTARQVQTSTGRNELDVVPNFVPSDSIRARHHVDNQEEQADNIIRLGYVGRLTANKNVEKVLDTTARVSGMTDTEVSVEAHIVGGHAEEVQRYRDRTPQLNEGTVYWYGNLRHSETLNIIAQRVDVLLLLSESEGLPMSILEGMALGKVPIVTAVGGLSSLIVDGENGMLIPPDTNRMAYNAAEKVMELTDSSRVDRARIGEFGRQAYRTVSEACSPEKYVKETVSIYREVVK